MKSVSFILVSCALCLGCDPSPARSKREVVDVFAASSLTEAFTDLEVFFETTHPEYDVRLTFGGSQTLRLQLEQGARGDVFASANPEHMVSLVKSKLVQDSHVFAENELVAVVSAARAADFTSVSDLVKAQRLVIGTPHVPLGTYTQTFFKNAEAHLGSAFGSQLKSRVVSEESNARLVRSKVEMGVADAAIVYRSDAAGRPKLHVISFPEALRVPATYEVGVVTRGKVKGASEFVRVLRSKTGQEILERWGFRRAR